MENKNTKESIGGEKKGQHGDIYITLGYIERDIKEINRKLDNHYVTQEEFRPVKTVIYGMVSTILVAFLVAIISLIIVSR